MFIDLRGYGYFDKFRNIEFYDFVDDIKFLLDVIYIDEVVFIGYEMGVFIVVDMFVRNFGYIFLIILVNFILIEGELFEECLFRKYVYKICNWEDDK